MKQAIKATSIPQHAERSTRQRKRRPDKAMRAKTFDELSNAEKDQLLKAIGERLGLIKES